MDDRTVDTIFQGSLENLPPVSSKIVRIFTSSTFTGKFYVILIFWKSRDLMRRRSIPWWEVSGVIEMFILTINA